MSSYNGLFYGFARKVCAFFFRIYFNITVCGQENIYSLKSGAILIANHKSYLDPILLGLFLKDKRLFFMAKKELFYVPILKYIIKKLGAFAVDRKNNSSLAISKAVEIVLEKKLVAMFPQGHRCKNIKDIKPKTGFVRIALNSRAAIVPCCLRYSSFLPRSKIYITYGKAVFISNEVDIKAATNEIWQHVLDLYYFKS